MRGILGNRGFGFDTGWLLTNFLFFFYLIENNLLMVKKSQSVAKLAKRRAILNSIVLNKYYGMLRWQTHINFAP